MLNATALSLSLFLRKSNGRASEVGPDSINQKKIKEETKKTPPRSVKVTPAAASSRPVGLDWSIGGQSLVQSDDVAEFQRVPLGSPADSAPKKKEQKTRCLFQKAAPNGPASRFAFLSKPISKIGGRRHKEMMEIDHRGGIFPKKRPRQYPSKPANVFFSPSSFSSNEKLGNRFVTSSEGNAVVFLFLTTGTSMALKRSPGVTDREKRLENI